MLKPLLYRPIGVIMVFVAMVIFSGIAFLQLPVSLLPDIEVPSIVIKVTYPNGSPQEVEQNTLRIIRRRMTTLHGVTDIESTATSRQGTVMLTFAYGTDMSLAYVETNEKVDRLTELMPKGMLRPQVVRVNTSDIPILRIHVIPQSTEDYLQVSNLTTKVLKKRLEQIEGISLVDINGVRKEVISISPNLAKLTSYGITQQDLISTITSNNQQLGGVSIKDGHYRYYVHMSNELKNVEDIRKLTIQSLDNNKIRIDQLATVSRDVQQIHGFHQYNGKEGLVINVHKQSKAQMNALIPTLLRSIEQFRKDYPSVSFYTSQDQSSLLNAGVSSLKTSLLYGGMFAFLVLFAFMSNFRTPLIIGISLPVSLIISFLFFYFTGLSINIISLSGLALGLGMLIDNAIIVLDNITAKRLTGLGLLDACVEGVKEVSSPLISSVLTTLSVFIPLIFLSGISGALFYDQAVAVSIILGVSLLVAFVLLPLVYRLVHNAHLPSPTEPFLYRKLHNGYKNLFERVFHHKAISLLMILTLIPLGIWWLMSIPKEGFPTIHRNDALVTIDWHEPITIDENRKRTNYLLDKHRQFIEYSESDIGMKQYLLEIVQSQITESNIYVMLKSDATSNFFDRISDYIKSQYPKAELQISKAPNAFDQIFDTDDPPLELRLRNSQLDQPISTDRLSSISDSLYSLGYEKGEGLELETAIHIDIDYQKLLSYDIKLANLKATLRQLLSQFTISEIKRFGELTAIVLSSNRKQLDHTLSLATISNSKGVHYPVNSLVQFRYQTAFQSVHADKAGIFQSFSHNNSQQKLSKQTSEFLQKKGIDISYAGSYIRDSNNRKALLSILIISMLLLYFILAAQFESFLHPLIVILTLPLGICGSLLFLFIFGASLNIMSGIGIVVMLGIIVNDSILKIDTINRLRKADHTLDKAVRIAGSKRLKPILMTSITTILALFPIIFADGIGADLQRPLVYAVMGGLTVGTFASVYFIPLIYTLLAVKKLKDKDV